MENQFSYTAVETEAIRQKVINNYALPIVRIVFAEYPQIRSAYFTVAQYSSDNAYDEVHDFFLYSVLDTPDWDAFARSEQEEEPEDWEYYDDFMEKDSVNLPGITTYQHEILDYIFNKQINIKCNQDLEQKFIFPEWNGLNSDLITAFSAFCKEGSYQDMDYAEAYTPYALLTRTDTGIKVEIVGKMIRPWLDGIEPESGWDW